MSAERPAVTAPPPGRSGVALDDDVPRGILLAMLAFALFTVMDTCVKLLSVRYATFQIVAINSAIAASATAAVALRRGGLARLRTAAPLRHVLRGAAMLAGAWLAFHAYGALPLADAYAILFSMPLIISALAVPLLGEGVGWRRWAAILTGFGGVLIMLWPSGGLIQPAAFGALAAAFINSLAVVLVRVMRAETPESFGVYGSLTVAVGAAATLPFVWVTPSLPDVGLFLAAGAFACAAFLCVAHAYRCAPASIVAPFQYSQMIYAVIIGAVLFGTMPERRTLLGAVIVIGSGLYVLHRESWLARRPSRAAGP